MGGHVEAPHVSMKLLILGGTVFVGRHIVVAARAAGHEVTRFNRGRQDPGLFADLERLRGDRNGDVSALRGRRFDAVIDLSGYTATQVRTTAEALDGTVGHYLFVSTITVYRHYPPGWDEHTPTFDGTEGYGPQKARAEETLEALLPGRVTRVRPGLIVGPWDPTNRFTYWPRRVAAGGEVLAPGRPDRPVQFIDARDLAAWCLRRIESSPGGVVNAIGPADPLTMAQLLDACRAVAGNDARFTWISDDALLAAGVQRWTELPLWIPENDPRVGGMLRGDVRRGVAAGITFRPLADTIRDTLAWDRTELAPVAELTARVSPITREREAALLASARSAA
jgi:2'-hydroxyisoflavone reductase